MNLFAIKVFSAAFFLLIFTSTSEKEEVKEALVQFMDKLSPGNLRREESFGWNLSSDPCRDKWEGVFCVEKSQSVRKIVLEDFNLTGTLDASSLCKATSLFVLSLKGNSLGGELSAEISNCQRLTHLYLSENEFSGRLPGSLSQLNNLKRLDLSNNGFSGQLPDMSKVSGLLSFLVQSNRLSGEIPKFDFSNLQEFNVSNNNLSGKIPNFNGRFNASSFLGNPGLCGQPLPNACSAPPTGRNDSESSSRNRILVYLGYGALGFIIVVVLAIGFLKRRKRAKVGNTNVNVNRGEIDSGSSSKKTSSGTTEFKMTSSESGMASSSLVVLSSPMTNGMSFEDLLASPAELMRRGKHGSLYKVMFGGGVTLAVKRIRDWEISKVEFGKRMERIWQVKHPNVMPIVAYYSSMQEKLLVYEFQHNGSLLSLLQGSQKGRLFGWGSRLSAAAKIAEALAFMHEKLRGDEIPHGNLKCSNVLLNKDMDPCISEYGLMVEENQDSKFSYSRTPGSPNRTTVAFEEDIYGLGLILLQLLTGKVVEKSNGFELGRWIHSVIKQEWTAEVFDKALVLEGASEERMVSLLQVALKCINTDPEARPRINQVASIIASIKEEEEDRSISSDP
ncbi:Non-specific serine/threonine protein kinase [Bertholletia excelsa]